MKIAALLVLLPLSCCTHNRPVWPLQTGAHFFLQCVSQSLSNGTPVALVRPYCDCALREVSSRYPAEWLEKPNTPEDVVVLMQLGEQCGAEALSALKEDL